MADVNTAPTATATQTRNAGSRMMGFYMASGAKVDVLFDVANFVTKDAAGNVGIGSDAAGKFGVGLPGAQIGISAGTTSSPNKGNIFYETDGTGWNIAIGKYQAGTFLPQLVFQDNGQVHPGADNSQLLGSGGFRWATIYLGSNPIVTSDGREKTPIRDFTAAELSAGKRIAGTLGIFQFLAAIAEKGEDSARLHTGVIAQDVWAIMADEGLIDPLADGVTPDSRYAFLCYDEWEDQTEPVMEDVTIPATDDEPERVEQRPTGETRVTLEAGNRFGVRADQLALFLIAAQEARLSALEAAL